MNRLVILLFLTPCSVFASLTVTARGTGGNNSAGSPLTVTPASNLAAGSTAVLCLAADNANAGRPNVPASIVDSAGNTWFRKAHLGGPSPNTLPENSFYAAYLSTAFTTSDSLVITFVNFTICGGLGALGDRSGIWETSYPETRRDVEKDVDDRNSHPSDRG